MVSFPNNYSALSQVFHPRINYQPTRKIFRYTSTNIPTWSYYSWTLKLSSSYGDMIIKFSPSINHYHQMTSYGGWLFPNPRGWSTTRRLDGSTARLGPCGFEILSFLDVAGPGATAISAGIWGEKFMENKCIEHASNPTFRGWGQGGDFFDTFGIGKMWSQVRATPLMFCLWPSFSPNMYTLNGHTFVISLGSNNVGQLKSIL